MKKINIGIVLIILTIILSIAYVIIDNKNKAKDIEEAEEFFREYLKVFDQCMMLPEEYRNINTQMNEEAYNEYLLEIKEEISKYVLDTQLEYIYQNLKDSLDEQYQGRLMYKEQKNKILSYDTMDTTMKDNIVTLVYTAETKVSADRRESPTFDANTNRYVGIVKHAEGVYSMQYRSILKKMDNGEYKVVYQFIHGGIVKFPFEN